MKYHIKWKAYKSVTAQFNVQPNVNVNANNVQPNADDAQASTQLLKHFLNLMSIILFIRFVSTDDTGVDDGCTSTASKWQRMENAPMERAGHEKVGPETDGFQAAPIAHLLEQMIAAMQTSNRRVEEMEMGIKEITAAIKEIVALMKTNNK
ncbi:hypothetical protein TSUD_210370 [Trifolium subterraneum]|uniref:Uncharacterized protein n=1 Tax=Trifolium subterraneum TaxID=3900 RepID=A0A2Z6NEC2_TRISU|nr:hypothetical protein TSUD_210370 [Trifolium subterraneum]